MTNVEANCIKKKNLLWVKSETFQWGLPNLFTWDLAVGGYSHLKIWIKCLRWGNTTVREDTHPSPACINSDEQQKTRGYFFLPIFFQAWQLMVIRSSVEMVLCVPFAYAKRGVI
jgi:hypothetical protein